MKATNRIIWLAGSWPSFQVHFFKVSKADFIFCLYGDELDTKFCFKGLKKSKNVCVKTCWNPDKGRRTFNFLFLWFIDWCLMFFKGQSQSGGHGPGGGKKDDKVRSLMIIISTEKEKKSKGLIPCNVFKKMTTKSHNWDILDTYWLFFRAQENKKISAHFSIAV